MTDKKKILFVDDDQTIAAELSAQLRGASGPWQVNGVASGLEAIDALQDEKYDLLLSDAWLPDMDGAALVKLVKRIAPDMGRIVLCGRTEMDATARSMPMAHQIVPKPCSAEKLANVVGRACLLRDVLHEENLHGAVSNIDKLPALPRIYSELTHVLRNPGAGAAEVADVIRKDIGMTAKALQLANSATFGATHKITNVRIAVAYLGFNLVKNLVLNVTLYRRFNPSASPASFNPESLQAHAFRTGSVAYRLLEGTPGQEDAFTAGMLHDIGKLVLASELSHHLLSVMSQMAETTQPMYRVEREQFGTTHAEIGGYLLMKWGLPYPIVEAITHHHQPERVEQMEFDVLPAVYVANGLVGEWEAETGRRPAWTETQPEREFLERWGMSDQLPAWRKLTAELCAEPEPAVV